jgi:uncharacterized protein YndB with AHSA1/START domain
MTNSETTTQHQITTITHVYDAPRKLVYDALTKAEHLLHWHRAGGGWTTPYAESDPRVGGKIKVGFASPDGSQAFDFEATFDELVEPEIVAYTIADGRPVRYTLREENGKTHLTLDLALETMNSEELQRTGWGEMLANLERHLTSL